MPYRPNITDDTTDAVAKWLLSLAYRPWETDDEEAATVTFDRRTLWETYGDEIPVTRREDFYATLAILADHPAYATGTDEDADPDADPDPDDEDDEDDEDAGPTRAFVVKGGGARRVHLVIALNGELHEYTFRNDADSDAWVDAGGYDSEVAREILAEQGYDMDTPLPDAHRVIPKVRPQQERIEHDPDAPRRCSKCTEVKPSSDFNRRGAEGTPAHARFASHCRACQKATVYARRTAAKNAWRNRYAHV